MPLPVYFRPLLALTVAAAVAGTAFMLVRTGVHDSSPRPDAVSRPRGGDVTLGMARFSEIQRGEVEWELTAGRAEYDTKQDQAELSDIRMDFKRTPARGAVTVTADTGHYFGNGKDVRLNGRVRVVTDDGVSFDTRSVVYSGRDRRFSTSDPVTFRQQRLVLTAVGMDLGLQDRRANFHSAVDATVVLQ